MKMFSREAAEDKAEVGFIMVHEQDHLMTTIILRDMINLYKR